MAARLIDRMASLIRSGLQECGDMAGEREAVDQLQRMDAALADVRDQLGVALARRHQLQKALGERALAAESMAAKARIAVAAGRDDLARAAFELQEDADGFSARAGAELAVLNAEIPQLEALADQLLRARSLLTGAVSPPATGAAALAELDALVAQPQPQKPQGKAP